MAKLIHSFETGNPIQCISIAPNDLIITGSYNGTITVWDIPNRRPIRSFPPQGKHFSSLAISGDTRWAVSGHRKTINVWDIQKGTLNREIETLVDDTRSLAFTPDGLCLSGHEYGGLLLWDLQSGQRIKTMEAIEVWTFSHMMADPDAITTLTLTPDGSKVIAGTYYGFLKVWDLHTYQNAHMVMGHHLWITSILLLPDGQHGMSADYNGTVKTWPLTGSPVSETLYEGRSAISVLLLKPNLRRVIWGTAEGKLYSWDINRRKIRSELKAHDKAINGAVITTDGFLITASDDGTLRMWEM